MLRGRLIVLVSMLLTWIIRVINLIVLPVRTLVSTDDNFLRVGTDWDVFFK